MPRTGISYEEVELQADALLVKGQNPTLEKVRRALGDRGSHSTLSKHLSLWRQNKTQRIESPSEVILPQASGIFHKQGLPDPVNAAVNRVWQHLKEESQAQILSIKQEAEKSIELMNLEKEELSLQYHQSLKTIEDLKNELKNLKNENSELEKSLYSTQKDLQLALGRMQDLESSFTNLKTEQKQERRKLILALTQARETNAKLEERQRQFKFIQEFLEEKNIS